MHQRRLPTASARPVKRQAVAKSQESKQASLLKSCGHKARLVTYKIENKNTTNTYVGIHKGTNTVRQYK